MIIIFSPTKQMFSNRVSAAVSGCPATRPLFHTDALLLNQILSAYSDADLARLMKMSDSLAVRTREMISNFDRSLQLQAIFAYSGTSFQALDAGTLSLGELEYAQSHLRILSGMYGYLKPHDLISPYRLEMKTLLPAGECRNLNLFWKEKLNSALQREPALKQEDSVVVNLASDEYSGVIDPNMVNRKIITVSFKENTADGLKTVGMYAKRARGALLRRILQKNIADARDIRNLSAEDYEYRSEFSSKDHWVFLRK